MSSASEPEITVIIPTRNPRMDYLERTIQALRRQTFELSRWELLLIDNGSEIPLSNVIDLSWHPTARHLKQPEAGLTPTRLMGIMEAKSELLVFVDDDNVLDSDYLETAYQIACERPYLGAWSGNVVAEFEVEPEAVLRPYLWCLCIREVQEDAWGNFNDSRITPWGAGMCVKRMVAKKYAQKTRECAGSSLLGKQTSLPRGANDLDLASTSLACGYGMGLFRSLRLIHLLPKNRLTVDNILKTIEQGSASFEVYQSLHGLKKNENLGVSDRLLIFYKWLRGSRLEKAIASARERGRKRGEAILAEAHGDQTK